MAKNAEPRRLREQRRPSWEDAYGMELESVVVRSGGPAPQSVQDTRRAASERRSNGLTSGTPLRLHGTRLVVGEREVLLLTLSQPTGGYRMVAVDPVSRALRELWSSSSMSKHRASVRHFEGVAQLRAKLGASVVSGEQEPAPRVFEGSQFDGRTTTDATWENLAMRLRHDGRSDGPIGQTARLLLDMLGSQDFAGVVTELLDASRGAFAPLADRAGQWLRLLGYDRVHAFLPEGPDRVYAAALPVFDADVLCR